MAGIFICYRRGDSSGSAGRLYDALVLRFGDALVFMDVIKIPFGRDYVDVVESTLDAATVVLVLIGRDWMGTHAAGGSRLDEADDPVRLEVAGALARPHIATLPVLV